MKNKSIGSLILLAVLAPACGGGGGGGGPSHPITPPRWSEQYRSPTSVDLRAVRFADPLHGIAGGKFGTFVRTDNGGATWYYLESLPNTPTGDVLRLAVAQTTTFAVGGTPSGAATYTSGVAWQSLDATDFSQADSLLTVFAEPWVDVGLAVAATNSTAAGTLRLRPSGFVDIFQGLLQDTLDSRDNPPDSKGNPVPQTPWTSANGLAIFGSGGYWLVCGSTPGTTPPIVGQIRGTVDGGASKWTTHTLSSTTCPPLNRFSMISTTVGFVCGDGGTVLIVTPDPANTVPLGQYWKLLAGSPAGTNLHSVQAISSDIAWVVGDGGAIWRIRNATTSPIWEVIPSPTGINLHDVSFTDPDHGFAVGDSGTVVKTVNGSVTGTLPTWTLASGPAVNPTPTFNAVDVSANGVIGLVVGNAGATNTLVRTTNGGTTWVPFATGIPAATNLTAVAIPRSGTDTVGFVGTDTGLVYFNTDLAGSGTWQAANSTAFGGAAIKALLFPQGDTGGGLAAGASGKLATITFTPAVVTPATPASATLTLVDLSASPPPGALNALASNPAGTTLYVGGDGGYLKMSGNAGATWNAVPASAPLSGSISIRALQAPTGPTFVLFAGSDDGNVWRLTTGSPGSWSSTTTSSFGTPAGLAFITDSTGWVLTQDPTNGGVFFTNTSGAVWTRQVLHVPVDNTTHILNAIRMLPDEEGFIVGANGVLIRTTTGGQ